jgi:predicted TIM-barrel fold metal-dependent hydrolase
MTTTISQDDATSVETLVVDADGHVMEVFGTWPDFMPDDKREEVLAAQLGVIAPREGSMSTGGASMRGADIQAIQESLLEQDLNEGADRDSMTYKVSREGGWVAAKRLADMDEDGIDVAVLYPTNMLGVADDVELFAIACRAYNDWMHDYCSTDPTRLVGVGVVPLQDIDRACAEARRCVHELGLRALMIRPAPYVGTAKLHDRVYDPFWREACDLGVGIGVHPFPFGDLPNVVRGLRLDEDMKFPTDDIFLRQGLSNALDIMVSLAWFIGGGICERFPDLQVAFLEGSGGWLPSMLERLEHHFHIFGSPHQKASPTEMFVRQCYISFDPDESGLPATAQYVGPDRILWASDYPHPDAKIPGTVAELREAIESMSPSDQRLIVGDNARRFYRL